MFRTVFTFEQEETLYIDITNKAAYAGEDIEGSFGSHPNKVLKLSSSIECDCYEDGTVNGTRCSQDNGFCSCNDGWYGYKCLFRK